MTKSWKKQLKNVGKKVGKNIGLATQVPAVASTLPATIPTFAPLTGIIAGTAPLLPASAPRLGTMIAGRVTAITGAKVPKTVPLVDQNKGTVHFGN